MKHLSKLLVILALIGAICSAVPANAEKGPTAGQQAMRIDGPTQERWWGAVGAIGCGIGIRVSTVFPNPYAIGGTVVMCLLMLADAITS